MKQIIKKWARVYLIDAMTGMALGLFVTLIAGLIAIQLGKWLNLPFMITHRFCGLIVQGLGTSMLQIPNIFRKPIIMLPAILTSIIVGPLSTVVFGLRCTPAGSGMGTAGMVRVFGVIEASHGKIADTTMWFGIILPMFVLPAIIAYISSKWLRKHGYIKTGDMALNIN